MLKFYRKLDGTVYSKEWSFGVEVWSGVLEWQRASTFATPEFDSTPLQ